MEKEVISTIVNGLIGAIFTLFGFGFKWLADYIWLKSPRLKLTCIFKDVGTDAPHNGYRTYRYKLTINIENHSKNDAYGLEITKIVFDDKMKIEPSQSFKANGSIKDEKPFIFSFPYIMNLQVDNLTSNLSATERFEDINNDYEIVVRYFNDLGKEYKRSFTGKATIKKQEVWVGW